VIIIPSNIHSFFHYVNGDIQNINLPDNTLQKVSDKGAITSNELTIAESNSDGGYSKDKRIKIGYQSGFDWKTQINVMGFVTGYGETTLNSTLRLQCSDTQGNLYYDTSCYRYSGCAFRCSFWTDPK
jgi:hypothetical protein